MIDDHGKQHSIQREILQQLQEQSARMPSLRDQFAMAALPILGGKEWIEAIQKWCIHEKQSFSQGVTVQAYGIADCMLTERAKGQTK